MADFFDAFGIKEETVEDEIENPMDKLDAAKKQQTRNEIEKLLESMSNDTGTGNFEEIPAKRARIEEEYEEEIKMDDIVVYTFRTDNKNCTHGAAIPPNVKFTELRENSGNERAKYYPFQLDAFSSTTSRKRKLEKIQTALDSGQYYELKTSKEFNEIFDNSTGARIGRMFEMQQNFEFVAWSAHREGNCVKGVESTKPKLSPHQMSQIRKTMAEYIMKSGVSFNHLESGSFRDMVKAFISIGCNGFIDTDSIRMPSQEWIRKQVEAEGVKIFERIGADIAEPVKKQECCLVLDFGKQIHNFLSVFVVYLDRTSEKSELKTHPFMFMPVIEKKTTKKIVEYIVEGGERLGLNRDDVMKLRVVGDGAANIKGLGNYFEYFSLCSCRSVQKAAERVLSPLSENSSQLDAKEKEHLEQLNEIADDCADLARALRKSKNKYNLTKLPVANCQTRWMTFVNCCQDIIDLFPQIEMINNERISELREKIRPMMPQLTTMIQVLKMFEEPLSVFEKTDMRLHEVAPRLLKLRREITHKQNETSTTANYILNVLCKSAIESLSHYTTQTISEPHLLASILCPGMRTLPYFNDDIKNKTTSCLKEAIEKVKVDESGMEIPLQHFNDLYDAPAEKPTFDVELNDYLSSVFSPLDTTIHPILFWKKHNGRFPRLSTIAGQVYCVISSESISERAFSALKRVFPCDKQSMDPELVEILMISFLHLNDYK